MASEQRKKKILVADDDLEILSLVVRHVKTLGAEVLEASDGEEALRVARREKPDLIVLDVMMPGRDGYAVLGELKADAATCEIPIVLLTAKAGEDDVWEGWKSGADYYITKPFSIEELMYFIDMAFGTAVAVEPAASS